MHNCAPYRSQHCKSIHPDLLSFIKSGGNIPHTHIAHIYHKAFPYWSASTEQVHAYSHKPRPLSHSHSFAYPFLNIYIFVEWNVGSHWSVGSLNTLGPRQNGRHFADDTFKRIFMNENVRISIKISLKFVPMGPINNFQALVQIMAWHCPGDKPLSEPMLVSLLTHICVTRPQWVNILMG